jgi:hypothetical protein
MTTRTATLTVAAALLLLPGCGTCRKCRLFNRDAGTRRLDPPAPSRSTVDPLLIPPTGVPTTGVDMPAPSRGASPSDIPPPSIPENRSFKNDGKELLLPDPLPGEASKLNRNVPKFLDDPAEVPGFAKAVQGVATGRKPTVDGFDMLAKSGYKGVLYLHAPDADTSAAKALAEKRGLKFESLAVSATNLKSAYPSFAKTIRDSGKQPLYVFDDDGVRTGSLWQIHFVKAENESADAAQVKAGPLGLRDANDAAFRLAVEAYLLN